MKKPKILILLLVVFSCVPTLSTAAEIPLVGHWEGVVIRAGSELKATFDFTEGKDGLRGVFGAPAMRVIGIPLRNVKFESFRVHFELVGDASATIFDGGLAEDTITGTFQESDMRGSFSLRRRQAKPLPYREEEVSFENGGVTLSGTLLLPPSPDPHPAVLFLHGSGPEGRFASRFLADYLARHGVAALIYDKRGVGASTGDWRRTNFDDLAGDALAGIHLLQQRTEIQADKIGIYGHSQGGSIAPLIASRSKDVAFVISAAGGGMPMFESEIYSLTTQVSVESFSVEEHGQARAFIKLIVDVARTGQGWEQLEAAIEKSRNTKWFSLIKPPPRDHWFWAFFKQIADYNPVTFWEQVKVPVLLAYGERDQRVPVSQSIGNIERAFKKASNEEHTIIVFPRADHSLRIQPEPGQRFEWPYGAPGFPDLLTAWVLYRFARGR